MEALRITPPFFYSYQCGSTLLTAYIPVYMYSISLQVLSILISLVLILSLSSHTHHPQWQWFFDSFPDVSWPERISEFDHRLEENLHPRQQRLMKRRRLIKPHQIISRAMNNFILLLSFGLCSPVLCIYIAFCISLHLCSWLLLIHRFVTFSRNKDIPLSLNENKNDTGFLHFSFPSLLTHLLLTEKGLDLNHTPNSQSTLASDPYLHIQLLNQELQAANCPSSLLVCKSLVVLTSSFFVTMLCWDMAGDRGGWAQALWVPIVGVLIVIAVWVWDQFLISGMHLQEWLRRGSLICYTTCCSCCVTHGKDQSNSSEVMSGTEKSSLEFVHSSLHPSPFTSAPYVTHAPPNPDATAACQQLPLSLR
jgi:hypothetical protein